MKRGAAWTLRWDFNGWKNQGSQKYTEKERINKLEEFMINSPITLTKTQFFKVCDRFYVSNPNKLWKAMRRINWKGVRKVS